MRKHLLILALALVALCAQAQGQKPWKNGRLKVSDNSKFLQFENGKPFFWLGDTGWLLPQRLNRDEAATYLRKCAEAGYNMVQVQVINGVPAYNIYGQMSMTDGWDFSNIDIPGRYGYWNHMDYIVDTAERNGIYIGMVCIWGGLVKAGLMNTEQARSYGRFLANRYKDKPNIVWIIGGDIQGDIKTEVWDALAETIKGIDKNHLMTYHPRGRHTSAKWFAGREWLDFNMFQSGHRRYGQRMGNKDYPIPDGTEEDSWMYVDSTWKYKPIKPVIDGEPSYEGIPQGLHDADEPLWTAADVRRYAYWSVFAGSCGHTYGHNNIMQMAKPGADGAYFADGEKKPWYKAMHDPGYTQMQYLRHLMLAFPYFERTADQAAIADNGTRYDRLICTRGQSYMLVYNYTGRDMRIDLTRISGGKKNVWWMDAATGHLKYLGEYASKTLTFRYHGQGDGVLIATDTAKSYIGKGQTNIKHPEVKAEKDRTE